MTGRDWWGAPQWAAYLEHMELPIKASSKVALAQLEEDGGENRSGHDYAALLLDDPLLALRLLREANRRLPRHMARDITTPLGILLALGTAQFRRQVRDAPDATEEKQGFIDAERRATLSARIAFAWGSLHYDLDQGELALAALLAETGEIELWAFAPECPQKALDEFRAGRAQRSDQAQRQALGFTFRDLSLELIERGALPPLIKQLIRGDEGLRARLARLAVDTGRHLSYGRQDPALPHDVLTASRLTHAPLATVVQGLPTLNETEREALVIAASALETERPPESSQDLARVQPHAPCQTQNQDNNT